MNEILISFLSFGFLGLSVIGVVALIPVWVKASTESELDVNHIYNIFWEEAGFRGHKIISASGCLFPFIVLAQPDFEIEGILLCLAVAVTCGFYHSSVYKNYSVLNKNMKIYGVASLIMLTAFSLLVRNQVLSSFFIIYAVMFVGVAWGGFAVYRRARLVRITRLSH